MTDGQGMGEDDGCLRDILLERECRLRILRQWVHQADWDALCRALPAAEDWFDEDGNVV